MAVTRTHFAFRIDMWDRNLDKIVEHIAGVQDYQVAMALAACQRWPDAPITLRQGARIIENSQRTRLVCMAELVARCPRCKTRSITFDVTALNLIAVQHGWQNIFEAFAICRHCAKSTTFFLEENTNHDSKMFRETSPLKMQGSLNNYFNVGGYISLKCLSENILNPVSRL